MTTSLLLIDQVSFNAHYGDTDGHGRVLKVLAIFETYLLKWHDYANKALNSNDVPIMIDAIQGMRRFSLLFHADKLVSLCDMLLNELSAQHIDISLFNELITCIHDTKNMVTYWTETVNGLDWAITETPTLNKESTTTAT